MKLNIKKLHVDAKIPSYAHEGDAGMDIYAVEHAVIKIGSRALIPTGLSFELPLGYVALVWDKSGVSNNHGVKTLGGVIDAGYRGEIKIGLLNTGNEDFVIERGDKVAQILIQKIEHPEIQEVNDLSETSRGNGGFGSTGKK